VYCVPGQRSFSGKFRWKAGAETMKFATKIKTIMRPIFLSITLPGGGRQIGELGQNKHQVTVILPLRGRGQKDRHEVREGEARATSRLCLGVGSEKWRKKKGRYMENRWFGLQKVAVCWQFLRKKRMEK